LFTFWHFFQITELAHILAQPFFRGKSYAFFWPKMSWAEFWAIFSQTHLVTLLSFSEAWAALKSNVSRPPCRDGRGVGGLSWDLG
jgi:hypothetical protein